MLRRLYWTLYDAAFKARILWRVIRSGNLLFLRLPPGHFYNPLPDMAELRARRAQLFRPRSHIPGVDLAPDAQWSRAEALAPLAPAQFPMGPRYVPGPPNDTFPPGDAQVLAALLRHTRPARVIEIGAGYSTAVMLDTADHTPDWSPHFTLIEPYPQRIRRLLRPQDADRVTLMEAFVQDVPLETFDQLQAGDVLFIDSSHVVRIGSDVAFLLFEVIPRLKPGVLVHFHDIFWPFEYPEAWIFEKGRAWNEAYVLRAFLMFNAAYALYLWPAYLLAQDRARWLRLFSLGEQHSGSLWLVRTQA